MRIYKILKLNKFKEQKDYDLKMKKMSFLKKKIK